MRSHLNLLFLFVLSTAFCEGQMPVDCTLQIPSSLSREKMQLSRLFFETSQAERVSIIAEINSGIEVDIPTEAKSLMALVQLTDPSISCVKIDKVLYFASDKVVNRDGNLLNYRFAFFEVPSDLDHFRLLFRSRLNTEGLHPPVARQLINPGSGYISWDAKLRPLRTEVLRDITARDLLVRVASEQPFVSVIEFSPPNPIQPQPTEKVWLFADQHWLWSSPPSN